MFGAFRLLLRKPQDAGPGSLARCLEVGPDSLWHASVFRSPFVGSGCAPCFVANGELGEDGSFPAQPYHQSLRQRFGGYQHERREDCEPASTNSRQPMHRHGVSGRLQLL
jgi:hypothetical protein